MSEEQIRTREILVKAVQKAWADESFKRDLLSNPLQAINSLMGETYRFPRGKKIVFIDEDGASLGVSDSTVYINISEEIHIDDLELNEKQLEEVVGGRSIAHFILPVDMPITLLPGSSV